MQSHADKDSHFLEIQDGIHIHYKIYKGINTFRKPQSFINKKENKNLSSSGTNTPPSDINSTVYKNEFKKKKKNVNTRDILTDAENELDVPDGMEEIRDIQIPDNKYSDLKEKIENNNSIIFVLLHSYLGCTSSWDKIANSLRQYGTVISFDRPGFGLSSKPTKNNKNIWENCSLEGLAECSVSGCNKFDDSNDDDSYSDEYSIRSSTTKKIWINPYSDKYSAHIIMRILHHTLDHEKKNQYNKNKRNTKRKYTSTEKRSVILIGHSIGARVALTACYYFPRSFEGIILLNPALFTDSASVPGFSPNLFQQIGNSFFKLVPDLIPPKIAYYDYDNCIDDEQRQNYQKVFFDKHWHESLHLWGKCNFTEPSLAPETLLLRLTIPVLVATGDHDTIVPSSDCRKILKILKSGKQPPALYAEFQQTGHCPMEEKPKLFVTVVESYLERFIKSISYERGVFTGSTSTLIAAYRNQNQDPFREGCIVMDNINGEFSLLCAPSSSGISKSLSIPKDLDEIIT